MTLGVWVNEGSTLPRGHGVAWWAPTVKKAYCLPVPLHRAVGLVRAGYLWLRGPGYDPMETAVRVAFEKGRAAGHKQGYQQGIRDTATVYRTAVKDTL